MIALQERTAPHQLTRTVEEQANDDIFAALASAEAQKAAGNVIPAATVFEKLHAKYTYTV